MTTIDSIKHEYNIMKSDLIKQIHELRKQNFNLITQIQELMTQHNSDTPNPNSESQL